MMKNLYPYYWVRELDDPELRKQLPVAGGFTEGDTIRPSEAKTEFAAYTHGGRLHVHTRCFGFDSNQAETLRLHFDPDHSGRRPHNLISITIGSDGTAKAEKMEYDLVHFTPILDAVSCHSTVQDGVWECAVELPLELVYGKEQLERRYIGFNLIRFRNAGGGVSKWSGLPGELCVHYLQGIGDLLFVDGLTAEETNALTERAIADSNTYYTKWEKQKLPSEILKDVQAKKSGFSLRLRKDEVERVRFNARQTVWGAAMAERIYEVADYWASKSDDELFDFILPGNPRAMTPSQFYGDPLTGGNRTTLKTCLETPFRFHNEQTGEWWYPGKKTANPTTGEELVVEDNGEGYLIPDGFPNAYTRLMLVAATRNYRLAMAMSSPYCPSITDTSVVPDASGTRYSGAIPNLAYAYILSGDIRYAYKAAIVIGRIAELYPYMNGGYHDGSYSDTVHISEPSTTGTEWKKNLLEAYDLIFDEIDRFHDDLQALFARKPDAENREREMPFDLRRAVEQEMVPYILYACEIERSGQSDWSMRLLELEMETAALIQNGELLCRILLDSKFSLFSKLKNGYYRDGKYAYDSSQYVELMSASMMNYPNWTYLFQDGEAFKDPLNLFEDPRFGVKEIVSFYYRYRCGSLSAAFGDMTVDNLPPISDIRKMGMIPYLPMSETVFRRMPSAREVIGPALAAYSREELDRLRAGDWRGSLLLLANALSDEELDLYRARTSEVQPPILLQDSEVSMLRMGTNRHNTKHVVLYGQPTLPHAHGDKLGLWVGAFGLHLLAFGGHYPFIWIGPKIRQWELHSASCNVVLIDGRNQEASSSIQHEHYEGAYIQVAGLESKEAYPGSHYERWTWLIQAPDGENAYVLDQAYVSNGGKFDYNTHGLDVPLEKVVFEGIEEWTPLKGTLAGEDVPLYGEPGYGWMKAVRKSKIIGNVSWTYPYGECGLKITALNERERELICSLGEKGSQEMEKSPWDTYVMLRDESPEPAGHAAVFTTIMEPYEGEAYLQSIQAMELLEVDGEAEGLNDPTGICVTHRDGSRDILISTRGQRARFRDDAGTVHMTDAKALFIRYRGERIEKAEALGFTTIESGGWKMSRSSPSWEGTVLEVSPENRTIVVEFTGDAPEADQLQDQVAFFDSTDYKKPSPYYIREPRINGQTLTFHTDISLYRGEQVWRGAEKAKVQHGKSVTEYLGKPMYVDVKPGDRFTMRNRFILETDIES